MSDQTNPLIERLKTLGVDAYPELAHKSPNQWVAENPGAIPFTLEEEQGIGRLTLINLGLTLTDLGLLGNKEIYATWQILELGREGLRARKIPSTYIDQLEGKFRSAGLKLD